MRSANRRKLKAVMAGIAVVFAVPLLIGGFSLTGGMETLAALSAGLTLGNIVTAEAAESGVTEAPQKEPEEQLSLSVRTDDSGMLSNSWGWNAFPTMTEGSAYVGAKPYPEEIESHDGVISAVQYPKAEGTQFFSLDKGGQVRNTTSVPMNELVRESRLLPEFQIQSGEEPQVLIMHTHTTESYEPYDRDFYDSSFNSRTTDESKNMVAVGNRIEEQLRAAGIGVIHDRTIHDYPSYNGSYDRSAVTVKNILDQYPSIKVVLDVHRDAIEKDGGVRISPYAEVDGKKAAQVMIISGCDDGTMNMPDYMENFRFACLLQSQLESDYPGITRPILFAYKKYNQHLTTGSILIEVGGHANSIDQAEYSGELIGKSLAKALGGLK